MSQIELEQFIAYLRYHAENASPQRADSFYAVIEQLKKLVTK